MSEKKRTMVLVAYLATENWKCDFFGQEKNKD